MVLLSFGSSALVEPKSEVAAATLAWGQAIGEDDPEKVLPLYSDDAALWGTLSPTVRADPAARPRHNRAFTLGHYRSFAASGSESVSPRCAPVGLAAITPEGASDLLNLRENFFCSRG
jgi:hypothetical protein